MNLPTPEPLPGTLAPSKSLPSAAPAGLCHNLGSDPFDPAGLCHDLGHGPFSHVFDHEFLRRANITGWSHEAMSCKMLDLILEKMPDSLAPSDDDVRRIKGMIDHHVAGDVTMSRNR